MPDLMKFLLMVLVLVVVGIFFVFYTLSSLENAYKELLAMCTEQVQTYVEEEYGLTVADKGYSEKFDPIYQKCVRSGWSFPTWFVE